MAQTTRPADLPVVPPGRQLLVVLSAPSASGKDAVRDLLMAWGLDAHFVVTATTRAKRPGEVEGRDYRFVTNEDFDRLEAEDGLIEHAMVYSNRYGVPRREIEEPLQAGRDVVARLDVQGAATIKRLFPDQALLIFIAPPSLKEAQRRLENRNTDAEADRRLRIDTAPSEMEAVHDFDHVVVNETDRQVETARQVLQLIADAKTRRA